MNRLVSFSMAALAALLLAGVAAAADPIPWDQAVTTGTAKQLAVDSDAWRLAVREQPDTDTEGAGTVAQSYDDILRKSETILEQAQGLAGHLEKGDGMAKTKDMFEDIKENADDIQVWTQETMIDEPTLAAWKKVKAGVNKLAPYYGVKPSEP